MLQMNPTGFHLITARAWCTIKGQSRIRGSCFHASCGSCAYQDKWRDNGMGIALALAELVPNCFDGTELLKILSFAEQSELVA